MRIEERETLSLGLVHGQPLRTMATGMGRAFSMVSREHARYAAKGPDRLVPVRRTTWRRPGRTRPLIQTFFFSLQFSQKPSTVRMSSLRPVSQTGFLVVTW